MFVRWLPFHRISCFERLNRRESRWTLKYREFRGYKSFWGALDYFLLKIFALEIDNRELS